MMIHPFFAANLLLVFGLVLIGCHSTSPALDEAIYPMPLIRVDDPDWQVEDKKNQEVSRALDIKVDFKHDKLAFYYFIEHLQEISGQNIDVNWAALEIVGIDDMAPLRFNLREVTLRQLLEMALRQVGGRNYDVDKVDYLIEDGIIRISTQHELQKRTVAGVYDVGWYLVPYDPLRQWLYRDDPRALEVIKLLQTRRALIPKLNPAPVFDFNEALSGSSSGGKWYRGYVGSGGGGGGLFGDDENETDQKQDPFAHRTNLLMDLIMSVGDIDEWLDEHSIIVALNDKLTIHTTRENHAEIEKVLKVLYQTQIESLQYEAKLIEVFLLLDDAEQHRLKGDYDAAMTKVKQARKVAPANPEALALEKVLSETLDR